VTHEYSYSRSVHRQGKTARKARLAELEKAR
jgi:hypothetical protein